MGLKISDITGYFSYPNYVHSLFKSDKEASIETDPIKGLSVYKLFQKSSIIPSPEFDNNECNRTKPRLKKD